MILETFLIIAALPFVALSLFFGTKGGYYDSDDYSGDGCALDVNVIDQIKDQVETDILDDVIDKVRQVPIKRLLNR